jgi:Tfp pilus assembly protein PilX
MRDEEEQRMPNVTERRIVEKYALLARGERGVILLVVLAMLQLLAIIGVTFAVFASNGGPVDAIGRVERDIQRAQAALTALLENPDDSQLQESALVSVDEALRESSAINDGSETPTPETRRLDGLLRAACALFDRLVALLREPRSIAYP